MLEGAAAAVGAAAKSIVIDYVSREMNHSAHGDMDHSDMDHSAHGDMDHSAHGDMDHSAHGGMDMHESMSAYLFGNMKEFFLLFRGARINTTGGLVAGIVLSLLFSILATMFSIYSKYVERRAESEDRRVSGNLNFATVAFALRVFLHYIAMLLVMSMNVWILLAVTVGHGLGYFIYGTAFHHTKIANYTPEFTEAK